MCMTANSSLIDSIVDELVAKLDMFSAYDVTRAAKQRGATENHFQMKSAVHSRWFDLQNNGYSRSLVPTPTGDTWLYHPVGADTQSYIDRVNQGQSGNLPSPNTSPHLPSPNTSPAAPVATSPSLTSAPASLSTSSGTSVKTATTDMDGRLPIYSDQLTEIGAKPLSVLFVFVPKTGAIIVTKGASKSLGSPIASYTVNKDGRVRLSSRILQAAFGTLTYKQYNIKTDLSENAIRVEV